MCARAAPVAREGLAGDDSPHLPLFRSQPSALTAPATASTRLALTGSEFTPDAVAAVARQGAAVEVEAQARLRMAAEIIRDLSPAREPHVALFAHRADEVFQQLHARRTAA